MKEMEIISPAFINNGYMPKKHTGFEADISPEFQLLNLSDDVISIAIIMDDLDIPLIKAFNHWLIWNIPKTDKISENIPYGSSVSLLNNAMQGVAYGINRYRGPKQPVFVRNTHRYIFNFYALDCFLNLDSHAKKKDLLEAMSGHIIQQGSITGKYKR
ncbi:YbhB/YbcL family Raf kinase inhibitor-like protein [Sedimentibacter sp. B4]|uniref:YbhB/YbcL family Raf kinase inhibitor-like protein n=1 Tax=Sedimentibacter sp. B4 TaxID=304766 RepID=UPI0002FF8A7B|nr:YbhB/YbcL family Raf kinase inhibitor-like protein [Sedimentibacter sp. B4]